MTQTPCCSSYGNAAPPDILSGTHLSLADLQQTLFQRPLFQQQRNDACFCGSGERFKSCCGSLARPRLPPHGVHLLPGFIPGSTCQQWIDYLEQQPRWPLSVNQTDRQESSGLRLQRDPGRVTDVVQQGELQAAIEDAVRRAFQQHASAAFGQSMAWMETPQVLRYEAGGLYGPHSDSDHFNPAEGVWQKVLDRDASLLLYLNQDYTGGELEFAQFNYRYQPQTGDLLYFPSHGHYAHQAMPVQGGVRYVIVSWAAMRDVERVQAEPPPGFIAL